MKRQAYILVTVLLLLGCRAAALESTHTGGEEVSATSSPEAQSVTDTVTGTVTGALFLRTGDGLQPVVDVKLAIGETLSDDEGMERIVAYDPSAAPVAYTDTGGQFRFENVQAGRYGLVLDLVMGSFLLYQEGTENAILFDITEGETTDLGDLEYTELPLPQSYR